MTVVTVPDRRVLVNRLIEEAASAMGIAQQDVRWAYHTGAGYSSGGPAVPFSSGTGSATVHVSGGVALHRLAVTAGGVGNQVYLAGNIVGGWTVATQPCYVKGRFARSGTLAADTAQHVGFQSSPFTHGAGIGVFQSVSAANFTVVKSAGGVFTGVDTGVAIDTAQNEFELYRNTAGAWLWRVNRGALTSMTTAGQPALGNEAYGHVQMNNPTAASALNLDLDYCFWAGRKAA